MFYKLLLALYMVFRLFKVHFSWRNHVKPKIFSWVKMDRLLVDAHRSSRYLGMNNHLQVPETYSIAGVSTNNNNTSSSSNSSNSNNNNVFIFRPTPKKQFSSGTANQAPPTMLSKLLTSFCKASSTCGAWMPKKKPTPEGRK